MAKRRVCLNCHFVAGPGVEICRRCHYRTVTVGVPVNPYGILTLVFIAISGALFVLTGISETSNFIFEAIGAGAMCLLLVIPFVLIFVFAYMDQVKKTKTALNMAHREYYAWFEREDVPVFEEVSKQPKAQTPRPPRPPAKEGRPGTPMK